MKASLTAIPGINKLKNPNMKRIISISIIAFAALLLAGCQKEAKEFAPAPTANELSSLIKIGEQFTITATKEVDETKTVLSGNDVLWLPGDQITLVYGNADNYSTGVFTADITTPSATATFTGTLQMVVGSAEAISGGSSDAENYLYGVFPASAEVGLTKNYNNTIDLLTVPFKSNQTAVDGSFDKSAFTSCGRSSNLSLKFFNINSVLAVKVEEEGVTSLMVENIDKSLGGIGTTTQKMRFYSDSEIAEWGSSGITHMVSLLPPEGQDTFTKGNVYNMVVCADTYSDGVIFTMHTAGGDLTMPITSSVTAERSKIHSVTLTKKTLAIKTVWLKQSGETAWNTYFGGTAGTDRNIAMDDEYVYIAESSATAKMWAISISDPDVVVPVNVEGVADGGAHALSCPRVLKNNDSKVNGGKDVLVCCSLTRGGCDPKLYFWDNGINNPPKEVTLTTYASAAWYGDTFTVYGTLQDGVLFFDKTGGENANGIVTFRLSGVPFGNAMYLVGRLATNDALGSHSGVCAYYPFPYSTNGGIFSPGRGVEARGKIAAVSGNIYNEGAMNVTLTDLDYDEGTNGFVLGYNFIEWCGKRYVIYGNQSSNKTGYIRVREGGKYAAWSAIASTGTRLFRRDLVGADGCSLTSANSGMDVTARVINGELYFAGQKQNIACGVYKLCYE